MDNYRNLVKVIIQDEMAGQPKHEQVLILGDTPDYLIDQAGFPELPLAIKGATISKACFEHGIATSLLQRLPSIIDRPKSIYRPANGKTPDSIVLLTFEIKGDNTPIIVPIRMNQQIGRGKHFNVVTSVYGKEGPPPDVKWKKAGLLIWEAPQQDKQ
jgi:hypothetical protein